MRGGRRDLEQPAAFILLEGSLQSEEHCSSPEGPWLGLYGSLGPPLAWFSVPEGWASQGGVPTPGR